MRATTRPVHRAGVRCVAAAVPQHGLPVHQVEGGKSPEHHVRGFRIDPFYCLFLTDGPWVKLDRYLPFNPSLFQLDALIQSITVTPE